MKALSITIISLILTTAVIGNAYYQKKQFYPSVVYITKSNPSMTVLYVQAFNLVLLMGRLMKKIFFGQLRPAEFEHLMERSWYAVTETCLAFTVFRDDFTPKFIALFTVLLFLKAFHWLAEDRVDYMERSPVISLLFHIRVLSLLLVLGALDVHFIGHAYHSTVTKGASVQLVFGFEYAILFTMVANITIKYILHSVELNSDTPWDNKAVFLLYTELAMGLIKVLLYLMFVTIMMKLYTLPLFAFRPMYFTMRNFKRAFNDVILSRRAIHNMNTLYPDATPEELQAADNVCIICREEMTTASKKLPCNHIFHTACLRSWFQRQQTCPTCRLNILRPQAPQAQTRQNNAGQAQGQAQAQAQPQENQQNQPPNQTFGNFVNGGAAPFVPPPFGWMPPFLAVPPPPPPPLPELRNLTEDELRQLEGQERANVEARIKCLKNIQVMLDASVLMMQQYVTAASVASAAAPSASSAASAEASASQPTTTATSSAASTTADGNAGTASPATETAASTAEAPSAASSEAPQPVTTTPPEARSETDELRRRRIQRFQQQAL